MTRIALVTAMTLAAAVGSAQVRGGGVRPATPPMRPPSGPVGQGFGNVVFPGTGIPNRPTHAQQLSATIAGRPLPVRQPGRGMVVPYPVPVFVGGWGYGYDPGYAQPVTIVNTPAPAPSVIINNTYQADGARPVMRDYTNEALPSPPAVETFQAPVPNNPEGRPGQLRSVDADKPTIYLVAFKDGSIYASYAYWVEGTTLHYITTKYVHNRASVDLVDADVSRQLNSERGVAFDLAQRR